MAYNANIRVKNSDETLESGKCEEYAFPFWLNRAAWWSRKLGGELCLVRFAKESHTFEVGEDGRSLLLTPHKIVDPALAAQFEGS